MCKFGTVDKFSDCQPEGSNWGESIIFQKGVTFVKGEGVTIYCLITKICELASYIFLMR